MDIDRFTNIHSIGDDSILHLPCLEIAIAGIDFINRHVAIIDKIDESILISLDFPNVGIGIP